MSRFSNDHEWLSVDGDVATFGITDFAQEQLGDRSIRRASQGGPTVEKGAADRRRGIGEGRLGHICAGGGEVIEINREHRRKSRD